MCIRLVCERVGLPTEAKKCVARGFGTRPWDPERAPIMQRSAGPIVPVTQTEVLIVTTNDIPGYDVEIVHGDVFGLIVKARNAFSNIGASFRSIWRRGRRIHQAVDR